MCPRTFTLRTAKRLQSTPEAANRRPAQRSGYRKNAQQKQLKNRRVPWLLSPLLVEVAGAKRDPREN
jgi:hypothetical protein